jgi:type IV pilus assembly protein PilE
MRLRLSNTGFTLIELMIVIVIVAVLTMVAYPAYQSYIVKANRAAAKSYLMDMAQKQQLFFNDSRRYAALFELSSTAPPRVEANYVYPFDLNTTSASPVPVFTITASPKLGTRQEGDGDLSIDHTGEKLRILPGGEEEPW